ncbi:cytochrome b561 [Loktanella atrilutea]|uniref:Cytochrome b561 n=1 Tax=Loktanella atrilutea TaxID=366533 RepID=A0A1M5BN55_LOKAT|nr:cytochrome b561 [Loktanella atrilutea]
MLLLVLIRMIVRRTQGAPAPVNDTPPLLHRAGIWGHRLLYLLMLLVPVLGALTWYFKIGALGDPHAVVANGLMIVALGHALVALYHHYALKDGTLRRMTRGATA